MSMARSGHLAALIRDGNIIVFGGFGRYREKMGSVEVYTPSQDKWTLFLYGFTQNLFQQINETILNSI